MKKLKIIGGLNVLTGKSGNLVSNSGVLDMLLSYVSSNVTTLSVTVSGAVTFAIISGNAKFYTDSLATTGESTIWEVSPGSMQTIYIKGTSGDSVLRILDNDLITEINAWTGGGYSLKGLNLNQLGSNLTYVSITGNNEITGDIADAPSGLTYLRLSGQTTVYGNIADAPSGLTYMNITGYCSITGDIGSAPAGLEYLYVTGLSSLTGDIGDAPSGLQTFVTAGSPTISGDLSDAPSDLTYLSLINAEVADYTAGRVWATNFNYLNFYPHEGFGLSSSEVDDLLIDLAAATWGGDNKRVDIRGQNASRTSASDSAVSVLVGFGVTVLTN